MVVHSVGKDNLERVCEVCREKLDINKAKLQHHDNKTYISLRCNGCKHENFWEINNIVCGNGTSAKDCLNMDHSSGREHKVNITKEFSYEINKDGSLCHR
jgi:hypothetical protein